MSKRNVFNRTTAREDSVVSISQDRVDLDYLRKKVRRKRSYWGSQYAKNKKTDFQLYLGGKPFPRKKIMTLFERAEENKKFEDVFYRSMDENGNTSRRLSRWEFVDYKEYREASYKYIEENMIADSDYQDVSIH